MLFKCRNCGGNVVYEPGRGKMYCPHCESVDSEDTIRGGTITQCVNCGAPIQVQSYASAGRCEHCGCYLIYEERVEGVYEPHMVLPFKVNKDNAVHAMEAEFGRRLFTPSDFMSTKSLEKMVGIYVPFWLYDYNACYDFAGEGTRVRSWRSGDTEYVETSYYQVVRKMDVDFDKIPVDASYAMEDGVMDLMEPYSYQMLLDFDPKYMSGFYGEVYNQGAPDLEGRAQVKARGSSEELMRQSLQLYNTVRPLRKDLNLQRNGVHYALMPVWEYLYRYKGKTYPFHVNGQTGKVIGTTPVSIGKVISYGISVFAIVTAICSLAVRVLEIL
ncbi:MAG: TFIIB-type zinc ribbon-containing protein [Eubacterium sp.]|nr:TFIIB-type zinc ribbon-containing protein [Eubacterium sp.]